MSTFGVFVFSLPGTRSLDRCLKSVDWADSVVVYELGVDLDGRGVQLVSPLPVKSTDWVFSLWGEECVEPVLRKELQALREKNLNSAPAGYRVPIRSRILGRWLKGSLWGPAPALRVGRRDPFLPCQWGGLPREDPRGAGLLQGWLSDYSSADLSTALSRLNMVCEAWAALMSARGYPATPSRAVAGSLNVLLRTVTANGVVSGGIASVTLGVLAAYGRMLSSVKVHEKSFSRPMSLSDSGDPARPASGGRVLR